MYSTMWPLGIAAIRWTCTSGNEVRDDRQVERLRHAGDLQPLRDAAGAQQVDHDEVERARLEHVPERRDAVDVLAARDRRGELAADLRRCRA